MKIAIQGNILETTDFYKISNITPIYRKLSEKSKEIAKLRYYPKVKKRPGSDDEFENGFEFTIESYNRKEITFGISIQGYVDGLFEALQKDDWEIKTNKALERIETFRNKIISYWSDDQLPIPKIEL
jgi:hypothetical protein